MAVKKIKEGIHSVGAIDWDRTLFDELIPLPDGTSYNSYIVEGKEKTVLIDTVDPSKTDELIFNLKKLGIERIDYVVSQHSEQDHSGSIPDILRMYPDAMVVTNKKGSDFLKDLLSVDEEKFIIVNDGDELSIGGRTLRFVFTPWVHWPETMSTYLKEDRILFTCDFFGSHYATNDLFVKDEEKVLETAKRYYSEIMSPFRSAIKSNLEKLEKTDVKMIAPSHGQVYSKPEIIIGAYKKWTSDTLGNSVVIPYVSMHGSTGKMVERLVSSLRDRGIRAEAFDMIRADLGKLAMALVDAATVVIASPTMLTGVHPMIAYTAYVANMLRPKVRFASMIGSYDWGGRAVETVTKMLPNLRIEMVEPVLIKGEPKEDDFNAIDELAGKILEKHRNCELIEEFASER